MKTHLLLEHGTGSLWRVLALACVAVSAQAQQQPNYNYPPQGGYAQPRYQQYPSQAPAYSQQGYQEPVYQTEYVSPIEFLPTVGRKFGSMFRRVFYGDSQPQGYSPHGYPMPGSGGNLDSAPPSYQSHYGQPQTGINQPRYQQPPAYAQPGYQQPPSSYPQQPRYQQAPGTQAPQYQLPPPPTKSQTPPPSGRVSNPPTSKSTPAPKTSQAPPKKYTPPTLSKKSTPAMEEMPPPVEKKDTAAASKTEYYPLPGGKPKTEDAKPSSAPSKPATDKTAGNNGSFLKGKRASKEGRVISPYPPYQELDVTGLSSGSLALDPTTQKVFEVP
ncbi:hypothetical protein EI77_04018 [Prosthecobacter fusiformis]|uniref:Uncharacterized protein n=1 Tax=Prosthecobacter fusiformis TaxID=48464 RepID=A0A4R7RK88_9BACT|nr:hypothetical protein [Prosthecobacter fusiformis]TDU64568.1 hypothetical protein EI77_04018 [Prosthecobacter fusiformis]